MGWKISNGESYYEPDAAPTGIIAGAQAKATPSAEITSPTPAIPPTVTPNASPAPAPAATTAPAAPATGGVHDWYSGIGRTGDTEGLNYWNSQIAAKGHDAAYTDFNNTVKMLNHNGTGGLIAGQTETNLANQNPANLNSTVFPQDIYGTARYNSAMGLTPLQYDKDSGVQGQEKPNSIGTLTGNKIYAGLDSFNKGIDPAAVYAAAGLAGPTGSYTGPNHSWVPTGASRNDTIEARDARRESLIKAGLSFGEAWVESNNGFERQSTPGDGTIPWTPDAQGDQTKWLQHVQQYSPGGAMYTGSLPAPGGIINGARGPVAGAGGQNNTPSASNLPGGGYPQGGQQGAGGPQGSGVFQGANGAYNYSAAQLGTPTQWNVTGNQTVAGQLDGILDPNSPLMARARARGLAMANDRGLANSSMAITASDAAMMDSAMPIAQADAGTFSKAAGYNADQSNQFAVRNANATDQAGQFNAGAGNNRYGQDLSANTQLATTRMSNDTSLTTTGMNNATQLATSRIGADTSLATAQISAASSLANAKNGTESQNAIAKLNAATQLANSKLDNETRNSLGAIDANSKAFIQTNASAAQLMAQTSQGLAAIANSTTMDAEAKRIASFNLVNNTKASLGALGKIAGIDGLSDLLTNGFESAPTPPSGTTAPESQTQNASGGN